MHPDKIAGLAQDKIDEVNQEDDKDKQDQNQNHDPDLKQDQNQSESENIDNEFKNNNTI
jgi:hypothetical protein